MDEHQPIVSTQSLQTPHGEQDENGTDLSLIRWMLSLSPEQRLLEGDRARRNALRLKEYGRRAREERSHRIGNYEALVVHAESYSLGNLTVRTISLDDLIRVKEHTRRAKDRDSLLQLQAIKRLRDSSFRAISADGRNGNQF